MKLSLILEEDKVALAGMIEDFVDKLPGRDVSEYVQGDCFDFAYALGEITPVKYWIIKDRQGEVHSFVEANGSFYDVNGEEKTKQGILSNGLFGVMGKAEFVKVSKAELKSYTNGSWKTILKKLIGDRVNDR